jgi:hypothetical protein
MSSQKALTIREDGPEQTLRSSPKTSTRYTASNWPRAASGRSLNSVLDLALGREGRPQVFRIVGLALELVGLVAN